MKTKQHKLSCLKKQLKDKKEKRISVLIWKLSKEQKEYIENVLHLRVEPYLYGIRTKTFKNISQLNHNILKDLHYMKKRGKDVEIRPLKIKDKKILDEYGVRYYAVKYKIYL